MQINIERFGNMNKPLSCHCPYCNEEITVSIKGKCGGGMSSLGICIEKFANCVTDEVKE